MTDRYQKGAYADLHKNSQKWLMVVTHYTTLDDGILFTSIEDVLRG